jgi:hypothetical protein
VHMELVSHIEYFANGEKSKNSRRLCGKSTKPFCLVNIWQTVQSQKT